VRSLRAVVRLLGRLGWCLRIAQLLLQPGDLALVRERHGEQQLHRNDLAAVRVARQCLNVVFALRGRVAVFERVRLAGELLSGRES
jgi:hypothetical protein